MVSGFISMTACIIAGVVMGVAVGAGEGVITGVGVAIVDSEIMPPGTRIARIEPVRAREGVGVVAGVAVGELVGVGEAVIIGVGVGDVTVLIMTLTISSLSPLLRVSRVNSNSAFPSVIANGSAYVFGLSLISVSITRILSWLMS